MAKEDAKGRLTYSGTWKLQGTKGVSLKVITTIELLVTLSGMNQAELAAAMGIGEGTLSEYLSGKRDVGPTGIRQFARALKVSPEVLARGEGLSLEDLRDEVVQRLEKQAKADRISAPTPAYLTRLMRRFKVVSPGELQDAINAARKLAGRDQRSIQNVLIPTDAEVDEICSMHRVKREDVAQIPREDLLQKLLGKPPGGSW